MSRVAIIVPTLGRPRLLGPLAVNVHLTTPTSYTLMFVADEEDEETVKRASQIGNASVTLHGGTYPEKTNAGVRETDEELVVLANDDVVFHPGWYRRAWEAFYKSPIQVVGGPDLSPATENGDHVTMPILRRSYIEDPGASWREPGVALHEGYHHNYSETELWALASDRGVSRFVRGCVIEHRHPDWGKADLDETYERGARTNFDGDAALFEARTKAWRRQL